MRKSLQIRNSTAEFLVFTRQAGEQGIEVRVEDETVWLTQKLMATLFEVDVRTISEHLGNVYESGELGREATIRNVRIVRPEGDREVSRDVDHYNFESGAFVGKDCERLTLVGPYRAASLAPAEIGAV